MNLKFSSFARDFREVKANNSEIRCPSARCVIRIINNGVYMKNLLFILIAFFIFLSGCASPLNQIYVT
ncbi:MAG: hypothetical protein ACTSYF_03675, partial [Promethearchaeota archaeon]